jgi:hypothetical protein
LPTEFEQQVSAQPPVKKKRPVKSKKKLHWNLINLIMAIYEILIVGAASSRDYAMTAIKRLFFAAGSRSHEKLM